MFTVEVTADALEKIKAAVEKEGEGNGLRIFQYSTGTPCCRKTLLGVTPDEPDDMNDEVESEQHGINFIIEQEVIERYGTKFKIALNEHDMPAVTAA